MVILLLPLKSFASEKTTRIAGANIFETAVEASKASYEKSDAVILVSDKGQVDSLTGTILAYNENAPMLLIKENEIPKSIMDEIKRLNVKEVYLLGGENAISKEVEKSLSNYKVTRIHGSNIYKTAIEIAKRFDSKEYFIVSGEDMANALSIGPVSAQKQIPILLTSKSLPKETLDFIKENNPHKITIIGGDNSVSSEVEEKLAQITNVERIYGKNRIETSLKIAEKFYSGIESVTLANSHVLTDALIGGQLAAKSNSPIILTNDKINNDVKEFIQLNNLSINVLGSSEVVKDEVVYGLKGVSFLPSIKSKKDLEKYVTEKVEIRADRIIVKYYGNDIQNKEQAIEVMRTIRNNQGYHQANGGIFWPSFTQKGEYVEIDYLTEYRTSDDE